MHINQSDATTYRLEVGHAVLEPVSRLLANAVVVDELGVIAQLFQVCGTALDGESDFGSSAASSKRTHNCVEHTQVLAAVDGLLRGLTIQHALVAHRLQGRQRAAHDLDGLHTAHHREGVSTLDVCKRDRHTSFAPWAAGAWTAACWCAAE